MPVESMLVMLLLEPAVETEDVVTHREEDEPDPHELRRDKNLREQCEHKLQDINLNQTDENLNSCAR